MPNFMKIDPVGAELFHVDTRTDRHDEANSRCSQFCERALKKKKSLGATFELEAVNQCGSPQKV